MIDLLAISQDMETVARSYEIPLLPVSEATAALECPCAGCQSGGQPVAGRHFAGGQPLAGHFASGQPLAGQAAGGQPLAAKASEQKGRRSLGGAASKTPPRWQIELTADEKERVRPLMTTLNAACSEWLYRGHFDSEERDERPR
jgi:hypothetical protein